MSNKERFDWSTFSDKGTSEDLWGKSIRRSISYDSYAGNQVFRARALTDMFPLNAKSAMPLDGGSSGGQGGGIRYAFKARILGDNTPHSFLPDPCDPAYTGDQDLTYRIISMHTTFISSTVKEGQAVTRGDIVMVELSKADQSYDLKYGKFLNLSSAESPGDATDSECFSLKSLVGGWAPNVGTDTGGGTTGGGSTTAGYYQCKGDNKKCGPKDDPTFAKCKSPTYDSLAKKPTKWPPAATSAQVIAAIKASGQPEYVQKIMFAFIAKEQPKFNFPNNNVAGIQLDGAAFGGTNQTDFDYQTCYRDSGGDQRIFAGFDTLEKGMIVFGKTVAGKMGAYKKPTGANVDTDADLITWNYYRQWNLWLTAAQVDELKRNGKITKSDGRTYEKDWAAATATFKKALITWQNA